MSSDAPEVRTASGVAAIPAAMNDIVTGTVKDIREIPRAASEVAAFPAKTTLIPLLLAQFMNSYDTSSMNVAISNIAADLDTTVTGVQTALAFYTLVMAAGMIVGSKLSDIWGRRRTFIAGVIVYGAGAFITALSPTIGVMFLGWSVLEGIGSCLMIPPIYILVTVNYKDTKARAAAFGAVGAAAAVGGASGPLIGGIITSAATWRLSFALEVLVVALIVMLRGRIVDPGLVGPKPKLDIAGAILSGLGMTGLIGGALLVGNYGLLTARQDFSIGGTVLLEEGQISPAIVSMVLGVLLLIGFGFFERHKEQQGKEPLVRMKVVLNRVAAAGLSTQAAQWFLSTGIIFIVSVFLQVAYEYSAIETGLMLTPIILGVLLLSRRSAHLAKKFPAKGILVAGFFITEVGVALLLMMVDADSSNWQFLPGLFLIGSGIGMIMPASVNIVQSSATEEEQGDISGVSRSVSNFGSSFGVALAGAVLVSTLITGITDLTEESTVLDSGQKQQVEDALQHNVTALSDTQVQEALVGQPPEVAEEVVRINASARDRAIGNALFALGAVGLFGLLSSLLLPGRARRTAAARQGLPEPLPEIESLPTGGLPQTSDSTG